MFGNGKVFVSHTHEDNAACQPLLAALDAWQVDYWFDLANLSAGQEFFDYIQRALQARDVVVRVCTPAASASYWMGEELQAAHALRAPNGGQRRIINVIMKPGYVALPLDKDALTIDATRLAEVDWLRQLREALEVPSRERHVSRRAVLGVGITSLAALGGMGLAGKLLFLTPPQPNLFLPIGHQPTATALPGASRIRWTSSIAPDPVGLPANIALAGQTLICASNTSLTAVNRADGKFLWIQRQVNYNTDVPPTVVGDSIYAIYIDATFPTQGNEVDNVYLTALSVADGSEKWHQLIVALPAPDIFTTFASAITMDTTSAYVRVNQALYACDAATGKVRWSQSAGTADVALGEILPAPTVAGNAVFAILGDHHLHAFSTLDGTPLWPAPFAAALPIRTQPVVANGMVYVGADGGRSYALDAATGAIRWQQELLNPDFSLDRTRFNSLGLTLSEGVLYICGGFPFEVSLPDPPIHGSAIQALDPITGKILWKNSPNEQLNLRNSSLFRASPIVVGDSVFVATGLYGPQNLTNSTVLFALNKQDGKVKWNLQVPGLLDASSDTNGVPSAPVVSGDTLYIISGNEMLYALSYAD